MRKVIVLIAAALPISVSAQTISDPSAFNQVIGAVRAESKSTDKFAEPLVSPIEGKSFKLTMPALEGSEGGGSTVYDYKDGILTLNISPRDLWPMMSGPEESLPSFLVSSTTKTLGSYVGQNAFGATARVRNFSNAGTAIAVVTGPRPMLSPMRTDIKADVLEDSDWWVRLPLPPTQAKAVAMDTVGIVEGSFTSLPSGKVGACNFGGLSATINRPSNYSSEICYLGANVKRIALMRKSTGEVIKEWTLASGPALGSTLWGSIKFGMNDRQLKAAYPTITDYRYIESENVQVHMSKNVVSSVEVRNWPEKGKGLAKFLSSKYGQPLDLDCQYDATCQGKWQAGEDVYAYLSMNWVTYQVNNSKPPVGYFGKR